MMRKKPRVSLPQFALPPAERAQHDQLEVKHHDPTNPGARRVQVRTPNRLAKYRAIGSIDEIQFQAGEAFAADWARAGLMQRVTANLLSTGGGRQDMTVAQLTARQAVVRALGGERAAFADLIISCCVFDESVSTARLRRALNLLGAHYGLARR